MTAQNTITDFVLETFRLNGRLLVSATRWWLISASPAPVGR
jgi:hypothetical protein